MKFLAPILVALLFAAGCASNRPTPTAAQIFKQRAEVEVLVEEIDIITRELEDVQRQASKNEYSMVSEGRDLDDIILVLREAKARLVAKKRRLREDYHVWDME